MFGDSVPDIQPTFYNHFHPHGQYTNFKFNNLSNPDTTGFDFAWTVNDSVFYGNELPLNNILPNVTDSAYLSTFCEGVFDVKLTATHRATQTVFENSKCSFVVWTWYNYPECIEGECTFDEVGEELTPPFDPYQYRVDCGLDSDCNGMINVYDVLNVLNQ